ncbi:MAG: hypothetical protein COA47_08950 [Robiginitomaculum sp.]|nr:MAG: hypothetical protein COA47_08950 [Robiginitomaculum sp.]
MGIVAPSLPVLACKIPNDFQQLRTVKSLHDAARKYQNCLGDYYPTLVGKEAILIHLSEPTAIVSIARRYDGAFIIEDISGPNNRYLSEEWTAFISAKLHAVGIKCKNEITDPLIEEMQTVICSILKSSSDHIGFRQSRVNDALQFLKSREPDQRHLAR